jgi:hypothetical protein
VLEELPGFTAWARRHASKRYTQRDFVRNNALGLAMTGWATWLVVRGGRRRGLFFVYYTTILTQQALFNTAFHAGTTVAYRDYSPGVVTGGMLFLPLWLHVTRLGLRDGLLTRRGVTAAVLLGGVIHGGVVAQQVYFMGVDETS